jgi:signal transduction histidine kinase
VLEFHGPSRSISSVRGPHQVSRTGWPHTTRRSPNDRDGARAPPLDTRHTAAAVGRLVHKVATLVQGRFKREGSDAEAAELSGTEDRGSSAGPAPGGGRGWPVSEGEASGRERPEEFAPARGPDDELDEAPAPRPSQQGSRFRLRNWRINTRLVSLIALPVVAATFFGALRIQGSMDDIEQLDNMQLLTNMTRHATTLASTLQEERDASAGPLISGESEKSDAVAGPRDETDQAIDAFETASLAIDTSDSDQLMRGVGATVLDIQTQLGEINEIRGVAYNDREYVSTTISRYDQLIDSLLSLSLDMSQATSNSEMIRSTRALAAFSSAKESASIQRAVITAGLARGERDDDTVSLSDADWNYGNYHLRGEASELRSFTQLYENEDEAEQLLAPIENGGDVNITASDQYIGMVFATPEGIETPEGSESERRSYMDFYDQAGVKIQAMRNVELTLLTTMDEQADALREDAQRDAIINAAITVLVLGISLIGAAVVARSMVRSLRRLQDTAQEVARKRLPEVVKQMSEADPQDVDTSVEPVGVYTRDEIGKVAQAFDDVHREAVRLAGEQALLRGNVNAMFTNLSRRSQGLIQRQLSLISELESREADPDQLSSLFKLDHLATRMRRNGENLLVLAGEEPGRRWTRPVPLVDVLRAAASEVEQYERIELSAVPKTDVAGRVVNDLVHLLAELLENATSFSSPQTKVKVTGHALPDRRILVEIHDTGIGLSPEDLAEINDRLANPPTVDVSVSRRMGLFVVGRLSLRHGIRIQLRPSDSGGTTALVMLPADVAQGPGRGPGGDMVAGPASAALLRDTSSVRRPPAGTPAAGLLGRTDTVRLPGRRTPGSGLAGLGKPPAPTRGQVPGGPERPALPSRPGAGAPASASAPEPEPEADEQTPAATGGQRPSWASTEDSGQLPVTSVSRDEADRLRGHDEAETTAAAPPEDTAELVLEGNDSAEPPPVAQPRAPRPPDELTDPLPASAPERGPERTPIFEEMESTWFGTRRAVPPPAAPAPSAPSPSAPAPASASASASSVPTPRPDRPAAAVPPTAQRQAAGTEPGGNGGAPWRPSANDERWRQAEQLREPSAGGVTTSGLPRRVPRANLVAGAAESEEQQAAPAGPLVSRAPDDVRGRLTNLRRGIQQGRQAGSAAGRTDRDFGPTYQ